LLLGIAILPLRLEPEAREGKMNAVTELNEELKKPRVFKGMSEVAVKIEQPPDDSCCAPGHEPFTDEGKNIRIQKCVVCGAEYFMAFSPIYRTKRTFEELSEELQLRLEEDHRLNRDHGSLVRLRWSDRMRKRKRDKKGTNPHLESFSVSPAAPQKAFFRGPSLPQDKLKPNPNERRYVGAISPHLVKRRGKEPASLRRS
jgi:hypothetical protein